MSEITILSPVEQRKFDAVPLLKKEERALYLSLTREVRPLLSGTSQSFGKMGFLLQLGYFKATGRFYPVDQFRSRDINYVSQLLGLNDIDLASYEGSIVTRHRQKILTMSGWQPYDSAARAVLADQAGQHASHQMRPQQIFLTLVDYCWKQRIEVPSYREFADLITQSYLQHEAKVLHTLRSVLTTEDRERIETLLVTDRVASKRPTVPITELKKINQSLLPAAIKLSVQQLQRFKEHFFALKKPLQALALSDRATEYYAAWVQKADHRQLTQFTDRTKVHLHVLAFIKHQFYLRQDASVDILLKALATAAHAAKRNIALQEQALQAARDKALQLLSQSYKSASQILAEIKTIIQSPSATPNEKYYKIEHLVLDTQQTLSPEDQQRLDDLDSNFHRLTSQHAYLQALTQQASVVQRRVAGIVKALVFDTETSAKPLLSALLDFQDSNGHMGKQPPLDFLSKTEKEQVMNGDAINADVYKCLLFARLATALKSGEVNLLYSYRFRAIDRYLIEKPYWEQHRETILRDTGLTKFADGEAYLESLKTLLDQTYVNVNERYLSGKNPHLTINQHEVVNVRTPATEDEHKRVVAETLTREGFVPVLHLLREIDRLCHFTDCFEHYSVKNSKMKPSQQIILAGILSQGCNIGISKLANISNGVHEHSLRNTIKWCFDLKNIQHANKKLVDTINKIALANHYINKPGVMHSSSDGR